METWLLVFMLAKGDPFIGGEYQTVERCRAGAAQQLKHWREHHRDSHITWRCRRAANDIDQP